MGHLKKGEATDVFANAISECISKGVGYYTNLPAGASSPQYKRKGRGQLQKPDLHRGWVLKDAHWRQSTMDVHHIIQSVKGQQNLKASVRTVNRKLWDVVGAN
jgi:hypothetical protein